MRRRAGVGAAFLAAAALAACSSESTPLAQVSGSPTTASSTAAETSVSSSTASDSGTSSTSAGPATANVITRGQVPSGLSPEASAVADGWFAYWEFVGRALSDPTAPSAVEDVGKFASGKVATDLIAQITSQKAAGQHVVGQTKVDISKASALSTTGTVCSAVTDLSYSVDAKGTPVDPPQVRNVTFRGGLVLTGSTWRVAQIDRNAAC